MASVVSASNYTKYVSWRNQLLEIQPTLITLHCNEYNQKLHYYPFAVKLDRCVWSSNTLNDLSNKIFVPNYKEDLNLRVLTC